MGDLSIYIMVAAAMGIGVIFLSRRFLNKRQPKEYRYQPKRLINQEDKLKDRIDFRKNHLFSSSETTDKHYSYRDHFQKKTKEYRGLSHVDLNKNFWWALLSLLSLIGLIILM